MRSIFFFLAAIYSLVGCGGGGGVTFTPLSLNEGNNSNKPDLSISSLTAPSTATVGDTVGINVTVTNNGNVAAADVTGSVRVAFFLSVDPDIDPLVDMLIGGALPVAFSGGLGASESAQELKQITIPSTIGNGEYYLGAIVDPYGPVMDYVDDIFGKIDITESDETNNTLVSLSMISITGSSFCADDSFEDDDVVARYASPTPEVRNFCYDHMDRLKVDAVAGNSYTITTTGSSDLHITLRNEANGIVAMESGNLSDQIQLNWTSDVTQTYYIEVSVKSLKNATFSPSIMGIGSDYTVMVQ